MKQACSRRTMLGMGLGSVVLGACSRAISAIRTKPENTHQEVKRMPDMSEWNRYGEELEKLLRLRTSPIAVKMIEKEGDIPKEAIRPKRDRGYHIAQCQAFALSRREGTTVAMLKEDHWCPTALMAYGLVKQPEEVTQWSHPYTCFEPGKYVGIVTAPLKSATFQPDTVIMYSNTSQLRGLLMSLKVEDVPLVNGHFFPPSCSWAIYNPMTTGRYWVVLPDPGEYERALTGEDEMMFSIPPGRMETLIAGLRESSKGYFGYLNHHMFMMPDFPQPELYQRMFKQWGLDTK
jgi:uncharacterized protein (DUF169 family)